MDRAASATLIRGASVVTTDAIVSDCDLRIEGGAIAEIGARLADKGAKCVEAGGRLLAAGLIDCHLHGAGGAMFEDGTRAAVETILSLLPRFGTTGVVATVATLPPEPLHRAVEAIAGSRGSTCGARVIGIHLEGPYLNPSRCGAQEAAWMRAPSIAELDALQEQAGGLIRLVTVAPELPGALAFIAAARARGVRIAIGHTEADEAQMSAAIAAGATHVTHLYNAMAPLHHRAVGALGVALTDDALSVELICDGHHLHRRAVDIALRCKPRDRVVLVSDGAAVGVAEGEISLFGAPCRIEGGAVCRADGGQLAGSCLSLDAALRNVRAWHSEMSVTHLLCMASAAPAQAVGVEATYGQIAMGRPADLVLLDGAWQVEATWVGGRLVFGSPDQAHS